MTALPWSAVACYRLEYNRQGRLESQKQFVDGGLVP